MRSSSTFDGTNLTSANNVSSVLQYVSICHATLSDRTSAGRGRPEDYLDGKCMDRATRKTFPHTKKADSSRSRRSSSTYENYNFPDSAKVSSWLSSKGACTRPFIRQFSHSVYLIRKTLTLSKSRFDGDESMKMSETNWRVSNWFFWSRPSSHRRISFTSRNPDIRD